MREIAPSDEGTSAKNGICLMVAIIIPSCSISAFEMSLAFLSAYLRINLPIKVPLISSKVLSHVYGRSERGESILSEFPNYASNFLSKKSKSETSIVCVAEISFFEHAGSE